MHTLMVTCELSDPTVVDAVNRFMDQFDAQRFAEGAFALHTDVAPDEVFRRLEALLGKDDVVYVFTLGQPWIGYGYEAMNDWLSRHLTAPREQRI